MPRQQDAEAGDGPQLRARKKGRCKGCQGPNAKHQLKREKAFMENREDWTWKMNTYKQELEIFNRHSRVFGVARHLVCCMDMRRDLYERDMVPFNKLSDKCYEPLTEMRFAAPFTDLFLKKRPSSDDSKRRRSSDFAEFSFQDRLLAMAIDFYKNQDCIIEELLRAQKKGPHFEHSSDAGKESVVDEVFLLVRAIIERKEGDIMESMRRLPRKYRLSPDELDRCMLEPDALVDFSDDYSENDEDDSDEDDSDDMGEDDNDEDEDDASSASPSHRPRIMSSASRTSRKSKRSSRGSSRGREVDPVSARTSQRRSSITSLPSRPRRPSLCTTLESDETLFDYDKFNTSTSASSKSSKKLAGLRSSRRNTVCEGDNRFSRRQFSIRFGSRPLFSDVEEDGEQRFSLQPLMRSSQGSEDSPRRRGSSKSGRRGSSKWSRRRSSMHTRRESLSQAGTWPSRRVILDNDEEEEEANMEDHEAEVQDEAKEVSFVDDPDEVDLEHRAHRCSTSSRRRCRSSTSTSTSSSSSRRRSQRHSKGNRTAHRDPMRRQRYEEDEEEKVNEAEDMDDGNDWKSVTDLVDEEEEEMQKSPRRQRRSSSSSHRQCHSHRLNRLRRAQEDFEEEQEDALVEDEPVEEDAAEFAQQGLDPRVETRASLAKSRRLSVALKKPFSHNTVNAKEKKGPVQSDSILNPKGQSPLRLSRLRWIKDSKGKSFRWSDQRNRYERVRFSIFRGVNGPVCVAKTTYDTDDHEPDFEDGISCM